MLPYFELRPSQDLAYAQLARELADRGARELALVAPMAWGKTLVLEYLAALAVASGQFRHVFLVAPQRTITQRMLQHRRIGCEHGIRHTADYQPRSLSAKNLTALLSAPDDHAPGVHVVTRQALCRKQSVERLSDAVAGSLSGCLFLFDEGHHHVPENEAGKACARFRELGAATVLSTGTPFHPSSKLLTDTTVVIRVTPSLAATETDPEGRPLMPRHWAVDRVLLNYSTSDVRLVEDDGQELKAELSSDLFRATCIEAMVSEWVQRGRPKTIMRVPLRTWAAALKTALETAGARVADFTGEKLADTELLEREAKVASYEGSEVDVIVACARFNEGSDWPLCSHVFNVRIPRSLVLGLQLPARAGRPKGGFEGYPEQFTDVQTVVYFSPTLTTETTEGWNGVEKHLHLALVMAAAWERYEAVEDYLNDAPEYDRFRIAKKPEEVAEARAAALAGEEHGREYDADPHAVDDAVALAAEIVLRGKGDLTVKSIVAALKRKGVAPEIAVQAVADLVRTKHPEIGNAVKKRRQRSRERSVKVGGRDRGIIRAERLEDFREVAEEFAHVLVEVPEGYKRVAARFSVFDAEGLAERLRRPDMSHSKWSESREELESLAREHGQIFLKKHGAWPTQASGPIETFAKRTTWSALHQALMARGSSLAKALQKRSPVEENAVKIRAFVDAHGAYPRTSAKDPEEKRLGHALSNMRSAKRWDLLDAHGLDRAADHAAICRRAQAARTPEQRKASAQLAQATLTPERRREIMRRRLATPEQRAAFAQELYEKRMAKPKKDRSEVLRRAWVTRRAACKPKDG